MADASAAEGKPRRPIRIPPAVVRPVRMTALVYLGFVLVLSGLQTKMIFPGQQMQGAPASEVRPGPGIERVEMKTRAGERVVGLFGQALRPDGSPRQDARQRPTVLFFYGNGDSMAGSFEQFEAFRRLGANAMVVDYLGYGLSDGLPSERGCYTTADLALAHLRSRPDIDPGRIIAAGWSLGGAVAVDLAHREDLAGLAVFCSFTSMREMVRIAMPIPGLGLLLKHRFENLAKIREIRCPTLIGHGSNDRIIPAEMSDRLAEAAGGAVTSFRVETDHNDFFLFGGDRVDREMKRLIDQVAG